MLVIYRQTKLLLLKHKITERYGGNGNEIFVESSSVFDISQWMMNESGLKKNSALYLIHCLKCVQIRSFSRSVFSRIRTEYGEIRSISPYSVRMRGNTDQKKLRNWTLFTQWLLLRKGRYLWLNILLVSKKPDLFLQCVTHYFVFWTCYRWFSLKLKISKLEVIANTVIRNGKIDPRAEPTVFSL